MKTVTAPQRLGAALAALAMNLLILFGMSGIADGYVAAAPAAGSPPLSYCAERQKPPSRKVRAALVRPDRGAQAGGEMQTDRLVPAPEEARKTLT